MWSGVLVFGPTVAWLGVFYRGRRLAQRREQSGVQQSACILTEHVSHVRVLPSWSK